jgi:hypothetical protein
MSESEYYATKIADADLDAIADAGDYLNQEQGAAVPADECDEDGNYVPTLRELMIEIRQARTEGK